LILTVPPFINFPPIVVLPLISIFTPPTSAFAFVGVAPKTEEEGSIFIVPLFFNSAVPSFYIAVAPVVALITP
jgi:hypothetical protein